jgi:hypothetical protein
MRLKQNMEPVSISAPISQPDTAGESTRRPSGNFLAESAQAWNLASRSVAVICLAPLLVALSGVVAALLGEGTYKWLTGEDKFAENLQVLFWLLAFGACFGVIRRLWMSGHRVIAFLYLVLSAGIFFMIGEELSWGQRIFGWATPESIKAVNRQRETNIHSLEGMVNAFRWLQMLIGAYGTVLPLLLLRLPASTGSSWLVRHRGQIAMLVPHYTLVPYFLAVLAWRIYVTIWWPPKQYYYEILRYSEIVEVILAMAFFLFVIFQLRKTQKHG